jgi:hypothetical protein
MDSQQLLLPVVALHRVQLLLHIQQLGTTCSPPRGLGPAWGRGPLGAVGCRAARQCPRDEDAPHGWTSSWSWCDRGGPDGREQG